MINKEYFPFTLVRGTAPLVRGTRFYDKSRQRNKMVGAKGEKDESLSVYLPESNRDLREEIGRYPFWSEMHMLSMIEFNA